MYDDWIQTSSGQTIHPLAPSAADIHLEDIARSLSKICRYNGHTLAFYSIAEHACILHDQMAILSPQQRIHGLLYQTPAVYLGDMQKPLRPAFESWHSHWNLLLMRIYERFNVRYPPPPVVKTVVDGVRAAERNLVMAPGPNWTNIEGVTPDDITIEFWTPDLAYAEFMSRFLSCCEVIKVKQ